MATTNAPTIAVPRRLLEELASYLGESEPTVAVAGNGTWTATMVRQLRQEISGYPGATAVVDYAADHAGQVVSLTEIAESCKVPRNRIASDLGAMSKAARRLFGHKVWPLRAMQTSAEMNYLMQPEIAVWWKQ